MGWRDSMKGPKPMKLGRWTAPKKRSGRGKTKTEANKGSTRAKGRRGEDAALEYLLQKGLKLVERNWYCSHKEIDLIMEGSDGLHFVEVRSRGLRTMQDPVQTVDAEKRRRIILAADTYTRRVRSGTDVHFDIVAVYRDEMNGEVVHAEFVKDAFIAIKQ